MKRAAAPRFAALTGGLLARKGEARPAMRPAGAARGDAGTDDPGWDDPGASAVLPEPLRRQAEIAASLAAPIPAAMRARIDAASAARGRAAFTLRLEPDRHLRLRLACAITDTSAQALVTAALDALLDAMPALAALAQACPDDVPGGAS